MSYDTDHPEWMSLKHSDSLEDRIEYWKNLHDLKVRWLDEERVRCADLQVELDELRRKLRELADQQRYVDKLQRMRATREDV